MSVLTCLHRYIYLDTYNDTYLYIQKTLIYTKNIY